jgi:GNAT superfamily N-acetyltransferase
MIEIKFLADCPETVPILVDWFRAQWPDYYADQTLEEMAQDFYADANRSGIPLRLVAFAGGEPAGTIVLRDEATWKLPEYQPGLGGLFVAARQRGRGIGSALVKAGMDVAREQGYESVFATTVLAGGILRRLGWEFVRSVAHDDEQLDLYRKDLTGAAEQRFYPHTEQGT